MDDINEKLDKIMDMVAAIQIHLSAMGSAKTSAKGKQWEQGGGYADDATLEGRYGNPTVFKSDPREWTGQTYVGVAASDVPPEYGRMYADMCDKFGDYAKEQGKVDKNGKPLAWRKYQEAGIFRAWARRNENKAPSQSAEELPF
jgi:hypothetical protein